MSIRYKPGKFHILPDFASRYPAEKTAEETKRDVEYSEKMNELPAIDSQGRIPVIVNNVTVTEPKYHYVNANRLEHGINSLFRGDPSRHNRISLTKNILSSDAIMSKINSVSTRSRTRCTNNSTPVNSSSQKCENENIPVVSTPVDKISTLTPPIPAPRTRIPASITTSIPTPVSNKVDIETQTYVPSSISSDPNKIAPLITQAELIDAQRSDVHCKKLIDNLQDSTKISQHGLSLHNGLLLKKFKGKDLIYIPVSFTPRIFQILHDNISGGHCHFAKVYEYFKLHFYTPSLYKCLKNYLDTCKKCQQFKVPRTRPEGHFTNMKILPGTWQPNRRIYIDFMGPLPKSGRQKEYICHITDHCTRFAMAKATKDATSKAAMKLLSQWVNFLGPPHQIFSDHGTHFISSLFHDYRTQIGASAEFAPSYTAHPNVVERTNQTLVHSLRNYVDEKHSTWDLFVESCTAGYNKRYHKNIRMSPHEALFGTKPELPQFTDILKNSKSYSDAKEHFDNLDALRQTAKANLEKGTKTSTDQANKSRSPAPRYYPEELVLLLRPRLPKQGQSKKFLPHYTEPYEIVKKLSDRSYTVVPYGQKGMKEPEVVHVSKLKRFYTRSVNCLKMHHNQHNTINHFKVDIPRCTSRYHSVNIIYFAINVYIHLCLMKGVKIPSIFTLKPEFVAVLKFHYAPKKNNIISAKDAAEMFLRNCPELVPV